jgi:hypothetical protein
MGKRWMVLSVAGVLVAGGCATQRESESYCRSVKPGTVTSVNAYCAIMPEDPVDPATANVEWKGQQVGFCCAGCVPKWNKMTPEQKDAALAKAIAAGKPSN